MAGILYIVATPIGNLDDITIRAVKMLNKADIIAAEDTRKAGELLAHHKIKGNLISYHEHNERERCKSLMDKLNEGLSVALVSDAGTPSVSDPGYRLLEAAIKGCIQVMPIPGVSAAIAALSASGLPTDSFVFVGFIEKKEKKRLNHLKRLADDPRTIIFYESPKRITHLLEEIITVMGDRYGVLAREMTKPYEEFVRGKLSEITSILKKRTVIKGECTLLVSGVGKNKAVSMADITDEIRKGLEKTGNTPSSLAKTIANKYGLTRKKVYEETLRIKGRNSR